MTPYTPPEIEKGDVVLWYPQADKVDSHACPAFVNYVSGTTVGLTIYRGGVKPLFMSYVRHIDDPFLTEGDRDRRSSGGWDYSPLMKRLMKVESALKDQSTTKRTSSK